MPANDSGGRCTRGGLRRDHRSRCRSRSWGCDWRRRRRRGGCRCRWRVVGHAAAGSLGPNRDVPDRVPAPVGIGSLELDLRRPGRNRPPVETRLPVRETAGRRVLRELLVSRRDPGGSAIDGEPDGPGCAQRFESHEAVGRRGGGQVDGVGHAIARVAAGDLEPVGPQDREGDSIGDVDVGPVPGVGSAEGGRGVALLVRRIAVLLELDHRLLVGQRRLQVAVDEPLVERRHAEADMCRGDIDLERLAVLGGQR